jgi:SAM-dependent methyltransferase
VDPQIYLRMRQIEDTHWWFRARRKIVGEVISSLKLPPSPRILDAGCGTGGNLECLAAFGNVIGVEADDAAIEMARSRAVATVYKGSLPDNMPEEGSQCDLVVMTDVLEHINADRDSLVTIKSLMKAGAYLVLTVPAFPFLWGRHDTQHHHKRRYVAATLRATIAGAGLEIVHLSYFNTLLFPLVAIVRLMEKMWPQGSGSDDLALPGPLVNRTLELICASEKYVIPHARLPFGVSLLAVARRA